MAMLVFGGFSEVIAQYNSINIDYQTAAVMVTEYNAAAAAEKYYDEQVRDILDKYSLAEIAAAGIYTSKHLDREALTSLGEWGSPSENHYYRRIYSLVSAKIIPELWDLSGLLLHYPHKAIYWGSYLAKTCTEVKSLCQQFESVVTNGTLSFRDINFLELNPQFAAIVQLSKIGDTDWKAMLNGMTYVPDRFSKEILVNDMDSLYTAAVSLANSGYSSFIRDLLGGSEFNGTFLEKAAAVCEVAGNAYDIYEAADGDLGNLLRNYWGDNPSAAAIFDFSSYDMTAWVSDYLAAATNTFYTQRYYIACVDKGSQVVCDYYPPTDDSDILSGSDWMRFETTEAGFSPTSSQLESVLRNSESHAGWSRTLVSTLNSQSDGYHYNMTKGLLTNSINKGGMLSRKAYAYWIKVTKGWGLEDVVYEETFDSHTMDLPTFLRKMNGYLEEYNENETGRVYQLLHDDKHYYELADSVKVRGCESAIISLTCTDDIVLAEGSTQYKCNSCGKSLDSHSKECAMKTTVSMAEDRLDITELYSERDELESQLLYKQGQLDEMIAERDYLAEQVRNYPDKSSNVYQKLVKELSNQNASVTAKKDEIQDLSKRLDECKQAIREAENEPMEEDDYYRIPAIMRDAATAFRLTWQSEGWWSGYTYCRYATCPTVKGTITFSATLSLARKPQYFLGIKIHRAITKISWSLKVNYTDTRVAETLTFDSDMPEEEKVAQINDKLSELARDYPSCATSVQYIKPDDEAAKDDTEDVQHLLWSSDRLAIARQVEARLMAIYANIVSMRKMMRYKLDIVDVLGGALPFVNDEQGRKLTLAERCRKRWLRNAADQHHSLGYNGKYETGDEDKE